MLWCGVVCSYMTDKNYDDDDYANGKVALGLLLYSGDTGTGMQWDYAIRCNYTYDWEVDRTDFSVGCLYGHQHDDGGLDCPFTYSM